VNHKGAATFNGVPGVPFDGVDGGQNDGV